MALFRFLKKKKPQPCIRKDTQSLLTTAEPQQVSSASQSPIGVPDSGTPVSLDFFLKDAIPSRQGLFPHEILMLEYAPHFKTSHNTFQRFWYWSYSVKDPQLILEMLSDKGFIRISDLRSTLEKLKLSELKETLQKINQKTYGKKAELIDRLCTFEDQEELSQKYPDRYYELTPKGKEEIKENPYVIYLHRHHYMSIWEMNQRIAKTHRPFRDILWQFFNEQSLLHFQKGDFGFYSATRLDMYQFLIEENKPREAFPLLCEVLLYDLSGLGNNEKILLDQSQENPNFYADIYKMKIQSFFPYENSILVIPRAVVSEFYNLQSIFNMSTKEYKDAILSKLNKYSPPQRIFSNEEIVDILYAEMEHNKAILSTLYQKAESRETAKLKKAFHS